MKKVIIPALVCIILCSITAVVTFNITSHSQEPATTTTTTTTAAPEEIETYEGAYLIPENLAEDTCTNEDLIFSKISRDTYDMSSPDVVGYDYNMLAGSFDIDGNIMVSFTWYGHNKTTNLDTPFTCIVSANKDKKVTIHYLGVEDNIIAGDADYKVYREDGKEKFTSRYKN